MIPSIFASSFWIEKREKIVRKIGAAQLNRARI